ncbi:endo-1,4-beta-xylanase [Gorillibacterium timonense]|uniref:endo-1,4-beta-xylanase n=1 Tax=Gorillibacterium timonense TaxID=1689269 RepID=UPI00071CA01B|nr:endo-1,4-beta-xylanase [Gorillibacterium timonense]
MSSSVHSRKSMKALLLFLILCLSIPFVSLSPAHAENTLLLSTDFEDGTTQGWAGRGGVELLSADPAAAHSGTAGLVVAGRTKTWHGPTLDVTTQMSVGQTYVFSGWVKLPANSSGINVTMTMQRTTTDTVHYEQMTTAAASAGSWVQLSAEYKLREAASNLSVYFEIPGSASQGLYLDDFRMEQKPDAGPIVIEPTIPNLKDVFATDFPIGAAFENFELASEPDRQLLVKHFNSLTPGNVLKWDSTEPAENTFSFAQADAAVNFAVQNGQAVRGHTLVWHNQTPNWVFYDASGNLVTKDVLFARMENHIKTVVGRYKGIISAWDVVNEVIDSSQSDGLRRSLWYQIAGQEYIEKAFQYAHEADPAAKLFINDYNTHESGKSQALYNLITRLQAKGIPVTGIGHQTHIRNDWPSMSEIENSIVKFAALGLEQHVTELDIDIYPNSTLKYDTLPASAAQIQATRYKQLFDIFRRHKDQITSVTFWGKDDGNSWLRTYPVNRNNWPLLFDERLQSKPAYWALVEAATQAPATPTGVTATPSDGKVTLAWSPSSGAASYKVKRAATSTGAYTTIATVTSGTTYTDSGLVNDTAYYYVISAVNTNGESGNSAQVVAIPRVPTAGSLVLQYRTPDANATDNQLKPHFNLKNTGTTAVDLTGVKIRYYFTKDSNQSLNAWIDWAAIGNSLVKTSFGTASASGADTYLEVSFTGGTIPAGGQTGDIQARVSKADWSNFNEADDYSRDATKTAYADWVKATVYLNGSLVWGLEP